MFDNIFGKKQQDQTKPGSAPSVKLAVQPQQRQPTAKEQPQQAPSVSGPLDTAKTGSHSADFQNVVDEAAIIFASGEERAAAEMILKYLNETKGAVDKRVWYMLLDIYHAIGNRDNFEQLSIHFAKRFGTSPPSWGVGVGDEGGASGSAKPAISSGRNVLIIEGGINASVMTKTKEFVHASKEMKTCKIDVSRMRPDSCDLDGFGAFQAVMAQLRKFKVSATLMGEGHVASWLKKRIDATKEKQDLQDSPYWLLFLEILQWRGQMEEFEDVSLEYTMTFEVSGPGWEPSGVMTIEAGSSPPLEDVPEATGIIPDELVTDVSVQRLQEQINKALKEDGEAKVNFNTVKRMDFSSAGAFLGYVSSLSDEAKKITICGPSELIVALFDVVGLSPLVKFEFRKR